MGMFWNRRRKQTSAVEARQNSDVTLTGGRGYYNKPTGLRLFTAFVYLAAVAFLVLVEIGNLNNDTVIRQIYFMKIDLSDVIPETVPNSSLINTIAQSIGLHDFYQVGLWNYCAGYKGQGVTSCSAHQAGYWFNPVEIILSELLVGASIALPTEVTSILHIVKIASTWMFACFLVGVCLSFLCIFIAPMAFSQKPRWSHKTKRVFCRSLPITILTFLALLFSAVGAVIATAMFVIFRNAFAKVTELNIKAELGIKMLAFEWTAVGLLLLGFLMQLGTCCGICCCTGRRKAIRKGIPMEER